MNNMQYVKSSQSLVSRDPILHELITFCVCFAYTQGCNLNVNWGCTYCMIV